MKLSRFIVIVDRMLRHLERTNQRIDANIAEMNRMEADRPARKQRVKRLVEMQFDRTRPN
jgi:Tfp pilus assembly protein PilN